MIEGEPTDADLITQFLKTGGEQAFSALHRRHTPRLLRLAKNLVTDGRADPEDLVQDTWVRAAARLADFQWRSTFRTWLTGILVNRIREHYRARGTRIFVELSEEVGEWPSAPDPVSQLELERVISLLSPGGRTVLILHDVEGYTHEEIGELLGIRPGTSKSQLSRARRAVANELAGTPRERTHAAR
jgi:RNA polymerase sigma-70 factor, ECF subfamily